MKIVNALMGGVALLAVPFLAHAADDMSYRYFQIGYLESDVDLVGANESLDGFGTRGSFGFANNFFVFTELNNQEFDESGVEIELQTMIVGLGGHYPLNDNLDLVGRVGFGQANLEVTAPGFVVDDDESGYIVGAGLRGQLGESFEYDFGVIHQDLGGALNDTGFEVAARYHFTNRWAVALEFQEVGDLSSILAGVRYSFAK